MIEHWRMKRLHPEQVNEQEKEHSVSVQGRVIAELMAHVTNDLLIGKKIKARCAQD